MKTFLLSLLVCLVCMTHCSIYYGVGRQLVSHQYPYFDLGFQYTYRPENVARYSPDPPFGRVASARLYYAFGATHDEAKQNKDAFYIFSNGYEMTWSNIGKYYYYTRTQTNLPIGQFISAKVELVDSRGDVIYSDSGTHPIAFSSDCSLETSHGTTNCSTFFNNNNIWLSARNEDDPSSHRPTVRPPTIFYGNGRVIYSHFYTWIDSGIRLAYRPENLAKYKLGGDTRIARMVAFQASTYSTAYQAKRNSSMLTDGVVLEYTSSGRYFYFESESFDLVVGRYLSIAVEFYDQRGNTIYRDSGTFKVNHLTDCNIEVGYDLACSDVFDDPSRWS